MGTRYRGTRTLCVTVDIEGWSKRKIPDQLRAQEVLTEVLDEACEHAGLDRDRWDKQPNGDGEVAMLPADIDEAEVVPDLIREVGTALRQANRHLNAANRVRLRMALASGLNYKGKGGFAGRVVIEACRLLDSGPVRQALRDHAETDLAVIVPDQLYQDVIIDDPRDLRSSDFWPVRVELPDKGFARDAWVYVPVRGDGPRPVPPRPRPKTPSRKAPEPVPSTAPDGATAGLGERLRGEGRPEDAEQVVSRLLDRPGLPARDRAVALAVRAGCRMDLGDPASSVSDLRASLALVPREEPRLEQDVMLQLGRAQLALGEDRAAEQTWEYLIDRYPFRADAYLSIGRLARTQGRYPRARAYLTEGLRLVREHPDQVDDPAALSRDFLMALHEVALDVDDQGTAERLLTDAAGADRDSPDALVALALRAGRRGDAEAMGRLFTAALARVPEEGRADFARLMALRAATEPEGRVIQAILVREQLVDKSIFSSM